MKQILTITIAILLASCNEKSFETRVPDELLCGRRETFFRTGGVGGSMTAAIGLDSLAPKGSTAVFNLLTNQGLVYRSDTLRAGDSLKTVEIFFSSTDEICLLTESSGSEKAIRSAVWKDVVFRSSKTPTIDSLREEKPYILTPPPADRPRINGAKIVGASAGKPFLFTIAATGRRPMTFTADGLPEGLSLNAETGVIIGSCPANGRYRVAIEARNSKGSCRDTLEIVIGEGLALTPHMGWNSWYIHQTRVTQDIMERSAQAMFDHGLVNFGYTFVNIDDGWEVKVDSNDSLLGGPVRNADGTIRTNRNFPDMRHLTDLIHSLGLKAGLYTSPGFATCAGYAGSLGHEAQDVKTYSDWGFDFLKYDWCSYTLEVPQPFSKANLKKPYRQMSELLRTADRDIILNICQYGWGDVWEWGREVGGQSWRTGGDLGWPTSALSNSMFQAGFFQETIRSFSGPGGWNDPDYLLFGKIWDWEKQQEVPSPFTPSEQYTCMTLWSMMAAPLIFSGELTSLDDFTKNVLCNAEVIDVNQDRLGQPGYSIFKEEFLEIWQKPLSDGASAVAVFNRSPLKTSVSVDWNKFGFAAGSKIRDLWRQKNIGKTGKSARYEIEGHGCLMVKIKP
jgi:alpha-galactosidase